MPSTIHAASHSAWSRRARCICSKRLMPAARRHVSDVLHRSHPLNREFKALSVRHSGRNGGLQAMFFSNADFAEIESTTKQLHRETNDSHGVTPFEFGFIERSPPARHGPGSSDTVDFLSSRFDCFVQFFGSAASPARMRPTASAMFPPRRQRRWA